MLEEYLYNWFFKLVTTPNDMNDSTNQPTIH